MCTWKSWMYHSATTPTPLPMEEYTRSFDTRNNSLFLTQIFDMALFIVSHIDVVSRRESWLPPHSISSVRLISGTHNHLLWATLCLNSLSFATRCFCEPAFRWLNVAFASCQWNQRSILTGRVTTAVKLHEVADECAHTFLHFCNVTLVIVWSRLQCDWDMFRLY